MAAQKENTTGADKAPKENIERVRAEFLDRLDMARRQKMMIEQELREGYFFAAPFRSRHIFSHSPVTDWRPRDALELNTSFAMEVCTDFPTVIINSFIPQAEPWISLRATGVKFSGAEKKQLDDQAQQHVEATLDAIRESNFYAEFGKGASPDLGLGIIAMSVRDPGQGKPLHFQCVPIRELEINLGADGQLDDRFVIRWTRYGRIRAVVGNIELPADIEDKIKRHPKKQCAIQWGWWKIFDESGGVKWQWMLMIEKTVIGRPVELEGDGCCELVIGRFGASPEWAWPDGPLIKALPDLRVIDELSVKKIKNLDLTLDPPITWPDDSFTNIEEGIETGMAYQLRPGTEGAVKNIYTPNAPDVAIYDRMDLEQRVKRLFFLDFPEQTGKTPPTLGQWLDEMNKAQQRIGTPGLSFWSEFCVGIFQRARYLLLKRGDLQPISVNGKPLSLMPYNPAVRAAEQQEVAQFTKFAQIAGPAFPEEFKLLSDAGETMDNLAKKLGADRIWVKRKPADVKNALQQLGALKGGAVPGAPPVPEGAPPDANPAGPSAPVPQVQLRGHDI